MCKDVDGLLELVTVFLHTRTCILIQMKIEFQPQWRSLYAQMRAFKISLEPCEKKKGFHEIGERDTKQ